MKSRDERLQDSQNELRILAKESRDLFDNLLQYDKSKLSKDRQRQIKTLVDQLRKTCAIADEIYWEVE